MNIKETHTKMIRAWIWLDETLFFNFLAAVCKYEVFASQKQFLVAQIVPGNLTSRKR